MEKAHCSKSKFFEKELLNPFQVNAYPSIRILENFSNPFRFHGVLKMKYCSEMDYIVVISIFV